MSPEKKKNYINNEDFLNAIIAYKEDLADAENAGDPPPRVPEYIGKCFLMIAERLSGRGNFVNYTFRDEMVLDAIENCLAYAANFDPEKSSNPFAYFTQIAYFAFIRRIQKEKRQTQIKHRYIEKLDLDSLIRQINDEGSYHASFLSFLKKQADEAEQHQVEKKSTSSRLVKRPKYLDKRNGVDKT